MPTMIAAAAAFHVKRRNANRVTLHVVTEKPITELEAIIASYPALLWHHCPDSRGCHGTPGLPDFVVIGPNGLLCREAKPHAGEHPRGGQISWKYSLGAAGISYSVWTPESIASGAVRAELEGITVTGRKQVPRPLDIPFERQLDEAAAAWIAIEYLQDPHSDGQIYDAADMANAWRAGYDQRGEED